MSTFANSSACISLHRTSPRGIVQDYVIKFNSIKLDFQQIANETLELIEQLISSLESVQVSARLIAKVNFEHYNFVQDEVEERTYYFPSYNSECIINVKHFFERHLMKIASRLDSFNENGSNLVIKNIEFIFVQLSLEK